MKLVRVLSQLHLTCALSVAKRTWLLAAHMSASEPKRTLAYRSTTHLCPLQCASLGSFRRRVLIIGCRREAARVHHISRRLGGVAARSARAAGDTGRRLYKRRCCSELRATTIGLSQRAERNRLRRWPQRRNRISLGGG